MTTSPSQQASASSSSSNGACGSSLPRWRLWLQTLNWRRNPDIEKQINASRLRTKQLESEIEQLRSESLLVRRESDQIESETEQLRKESLRVRSETEQIEKEIEQIEKENARLSELNSKLDAIVFSSATNLTPTKPTPSESEI
jgi:chromosome segregation ATPase